MNIHTIYLGVARSADRDTAVRGPWTATPSTSWRGPRSKKTCYGAVRGPRRLVMARSAVQEVGGRGEMAVNGWLGGRQAAGYSVALADFGWRASKRAVRGPQSWQTRGPRSTELAKARSAVHEAGHDFTKARYAVQMDRDPASNP